MPKLWFSVVRPPSSLAYARDYGVPKQPFIWTANYSAASSGLLFKNFLIYSESFCLTLHPSKDLAVSPLCRHRNIPSPFGLGRRTFRLGRHCSHLFLADEGNYPLLLIPLARNWVFGLSSPKDFNLRERLHTGLGFPSNCYILTLKFDFCQIKFMAI